LGDPVNGFLEICRFGVGVDRAFVRPLARLAMRAELEMADLQRRLLPFGLEVERDPPNVVLRRIRMGNRLPEAPPFAP